MKFVFFIILVALTFAGPASAEEVYRWVDDKGVTQFTAKPPKDRKATRISTKTGHSEPVGYSHYKSDNKSHSKPEPVPKENPVSTRDDEACEAARENLRILQTGGRIAVEEDGERRYLDEKEKQQRMEQAQRTIGQAC